MEIDRVFISTYRYDFHLAKITIASIRYWYPDIPIFLIKDEGAGAFNTSEVENTWNVQVLDTNRKKFGWGYGKLEPLFLESMFSFLVLDADTVLAGPVVDKVTKIDADFIVDEEVQPKSRFNEIYYNLDRINELDKLFVYPGYSFNSGQWFGTSGILTRADFAETLNWTEPPECKFPDIVFKGDQAHLNYLLHKFEQQHRIKVARIPLMVWPEKQRADFINIEDIKEKKRNFPFVIHWAGMGSDISKLTRQDILRFYRQYYNSRNGMFRIVADTLMNHYLPVERKVLNKLRSR